MVFLQREVGVAGRGARDGVVREGCGRGPEDVVVVGEEGEEDAEEEACCWRESVGVQCFEEEERTYARLSGRSQRGRSLLLAL